MLLELQKDIIYGPVNSRRLGRSLGLNILPPSEKICTFNCLYCQYGWKKKNNLKNHTLVFPSQREVLTAVESALKKIQPSPAYISFSGNGEATLHPEFPEIVEGILFLRKKWTPESKIAILSNSSTVDLPKIKNALEKLDLRIMKLDVGEAKTFASFNRPKDDIKLESIISGLSLLKDVTIQTLLTSGQQGNFHIKNMIAWVGKIKKISPVYVQLYTLDRASPCPDISHLGQNHMQIVKKKLAQENIDAKIY